MTGTPEQITEKKAYRCITGSGQMSGSSSGITGSNWSIRKSRL